MVGVPVAPRRVFGVAVGAGGEAGRRTWVCRAYPGVDGVRVESVDRLAELPGGGLEAGDVVRALVAKILEAPRSAWGFDAPFGVAAKPGRSRRTDAEHGEERLGTKVDARALVADILAAVRGQRSVAVLPLDPLPCVPEGAPASMLAAAPSTYVLEVGPQRLLGRLRHVHGDQVTGLAAGPDEDREGLVRALVAAGQLRPMARALRLRIAADSGATEAVLSAVAVWHGYRSYDHSALHGDPDYRGEGYCYC